MGTQLAELNPETTPAELISYLRDWVQRFTKSWADPADAKPQDYPPNYIPGRIDTYKHMHCILNVLEIEMGMATPEEIAARGTF